MFGIAAPPTAAGERGNHPLRSHALLMATYGTAVASGLVMADRMHRLPRTPSLSDVVLLGAATAKAARLLSRAKVTMIVRAPFTEYQRDAGHGEVDEAPTGGGLHRALGEEEEDEQEGGARGSGHGSSPSSSGCRPSAWRQRMTARSRACTDSRWPARDST